MQSVWFRQLRQAAINGNLIGNLGRRSVENSAAKVSDDRRVCIRAGFVEEFVETVTYTNGTDLAREFQRRRPRGRG